MKKELEPLFSEAIELKKKGDLHCARRLLVGLSQRDPESAAVLAVLGDVYWDMGSFEQAVASFRRATELRPKLEAVSLEPVINFD